MVCAHVIICVCVGAACGAFARAIVPARRVVVKFGSPVGLLFSSVACVAHLRVLCGSMIHFLGAL